MSRFGKFASIGWLLLLLPLLLSACIPGVGPNPPSSSAAPNCPAAPAASDEVSQAHFFTSCCPTTSTPTTTSQPAAVAPIMRLDAQTPTRTVAAWFDITSSFPRSYLNAAKLALANAIDAAVTPGEQGLTVYVSVIDHDSWSPEATLQVIQVPSFPADPPLPKLKAAPPSTNDDYTDAQQDEDTQTANCSTLAAYYETLAQSHQQLASIQQSVKKQTNALRNLALPPVDDVATDLWGSIERSSSWFQGAAGQGWYIAFTDLWGNTDEQRTSSFSFTGVQVRIDWNFCGDNATAPDCIDNQNWWTSRFLQAGAASVKISDPATSQALPTLFS